MPDSYIKLYTSGSTPDSVYYLNEGHIFFYASTVDRYSISGKNLIIGAGEVILSGKNNTNFPRSETAITDKNSEVKKISREKFFEGLNVFSFVLNTSIVLAKQVMLTNKIINKNLSALSADEKKVKEYSSEYYRIIARLKSEYEKRKLPWLKDLIKNHELNLTYKRGEAYCRAPEPTRLTTSKALSDKSVEFQRGAVICEENTSGEEMYILQTGTIEVSINGNKVAVIDEPGTAIGEMALLLGEKRTATLKAMNSVVITKIMKSELKEIADKDPELLKGIACALALRHSHNVEKINSINKTIMTEQLAGDSSASKTPQGPKAHKDLQSLKMDIEEAIKGKDVSFMEDIIEQL
jgi:CRP-like cAMP-binding protein